MLKGSVGELVTRRSTSIPAIPRVDLLVVCVIAEAKLVAPNMRIDLEIRLQEIAGLEGSRTSHSPLTVDQVNRHC